MSKGRHGLEALLVPPEIPVAGGPVETAPGKEAHGVTLAADLKSIAVVLNLVDPVGTGGHLVGERRDAGQDEVPGLGLHRTT
jgi:hypothetical protein